MISDRLRRTGGNKKAEARAHAARLREQGIRILSLDIGEPDFITPAVIRNAAKQALDEGFTHYTPTEGMKELRTAIAKKLRSENELSYTPEEIIITAGAKQAISNAIFSICNPGDEVIIPTPCWDSYPQMVKLAGAIPVSVPLSPESHFYPTVEGIKEKITSKTKCLLLNTPHNPTGVVYPRELLASIGQLAVDYDFYIISDEIYEYLSYERKCVSIGSLNPAIKAHTITINGFSKSYAMTGWRLGYAAGPQEIISAMKVFQSYTTSNANSIAQEAAITALDSAHDEVSHMVSAFKERRDFIQHELLSAGLSHFANPEGTFYIWADVSQYFGRSWDGHLIENSDDLATYLLEKAHVSVNGGSPFQSKTHIRISYSVSMNDLKAALQQIKEALAALH